MCWGTKLSVSRRGVDGSYNDVYGTKNNNYYENKPQA